MLLDDILSNEDIISRLRQYDALLHKWQKSINLVAPSTLKNSWERHIMDSLAFVPHLPKQSRYIVDIGSGGGFPPLALAMALPNIEFTAIDSDERKVIFMQSVSRETNLTNFRAVTGRAEDVLPTIEHIDCLTSRALASLTDLISFLRLCQGSPEGLFTKGAQVSEEIELAQSQHEFNYEQYRHEYSPETSFVHVRL
jgi:16S rRNA (guanine527-N7)-methyltransferase